MQWSLLLPTVATARPARGQMGRRGHKYQGPLAVSGRTALNLGSQASAFKRTLLWPARLPAPQGAEPTARTELPQADRARGVPAWTASPGRCHCKCISGWPWDSLKGGGGAWR